MGLPLSSSSYVHRMFHEKPSSYWGSPFFRNTHMSSSGTMTHRPTGPIKGARGVVVETTFGRPGNEMKRAAEDGTKWRCI